MIWLLAQPAKQKLSKVIVSVFGVWGDGAPRFDGPVFISDMRLLGLPPTPAPNVNVWHEKRDANAVAPYPLSGDEPTSLGGGARAVDDPQRKSARINTCTELCVESGFGR
jgi:hypothetical protein